uniref:PNPLA domain-containing protein n=1 Tax=Pyrodinium bahamense TaxID=73915 RepID=A0A7S0B7Z5_9DINO
METRMPVSRIIFEMLVVYNMTQTLLNLYVFVHLVWEARAQGFPYPWGNQFSYTKEGHRLGYYIWFHYHCCQLELLDTLFVVIRKKFRKITFLHVWLRLLNMWGWFFACRYACGGDAYFPAATNAATRAVVYAFYSLSLLTERGVPLFRKARVTGVQMLQLLLCAAHAVYCLYAFWDMQIPRLVLVLYLLVMLNGLVLYTDFHFQAEGKSKTDSEPSTRKVSFAFDSSGWLYCYHFGVASWLWDHLLPEGLCPEDCDTAKYPADLTFSGSSGGALAATALSVGTDPATVFEHVLEKHPECQCNPFRMLPAVEDVLRKTLPDNAWRSCTGRMRVVLTRMSLRYPFFTAEVVNQFRSNEDLFHTLRATCHVPLVAGFGPYRYDGNCYLDGLLWPQLLVPWKGALDDFRVRVSACSMPSSDIKPPMLPIWWTVFPPSVLTLRGLFWMGYRDAGRWFTQSPHSGFDCLSCRRPVELPGSAESQVDTDASISPVAGASEAEPPSPSSSFVRSRRNRTTSRVSLAAAAAEADDSGGAPEEDRSVTWAAARGLLRRTPAQGCCLPEADAASGRRPEDLIADCMVALERDRRRVVLAAAPLCALAAAWLLGAGL